MSHQAGTWIARLSAQIIELIACSRLHARSQPDRVRLATLLRLKFLDIIITRMAAQMKERLGSSGRIVLLALLGDKVYGNSNGGLTFEVPGILTMRGLLEEPSNNVKLFIAAVQTQVKVQIEYKDAL
jgi:hypothetical protein